MCVICRIRVEIKTEITTGTRRGIKTGNVAERTKRRVMKEMKGREIGSESEKTDRREAKRREAMAPISGVKPIHRLII